MALDSDESGNAQEKLQDAVGSKVEPIYLKTKGEIWEHFLDKNGQDKAKAASAAARELSGESSGKAYRNARRNFELRKGEFMGKKSGDTAKWREFGKTLPPTGISIPENKITITVKGTQQNGERDRSFTTTFTGSDAYTFANSPSYRAFFKKLGSGYPDWVINKLDGGDSAELEITNVS